MTLAPPSWPDASVQSFLPAECQWWVEDNGSLTRGRLVRVFIPHIDQEPMVLVPEGRSDPTAHDRADYRVEPFNIKMRHTAPKIPIAGLPHVKGENRSVYRGKVRPSLVLSVGGQDVPKSLVPSAARWICAKTMIVAPYFGADQDGTRGGWPPAFVERIRRAEYPQYVWDQLPLSDVRESILRLDQVQAVGRSSIATEITPYALSKDAMNIIDEWLTWLFQDGLPADGYLKDVRRVLLDA